jgi:hypothetical protein
LVASIFNSKFLLDAEDAGFAAAKASKEFNNNAAEAAVVV